MATTTQFETARIEDLTRDGGWAPLRRHFDVRAFGINGWTADEAGKTVIGEHDEERSGQEELYLVLSGKATFTVDGADVEAVPGTVVFVRDPAAKRTAVADEPGTTILAVGGTPGEEYRLRAWEANAEIFPLFGAGDVAEAKRRLEEEIGRYEGNELLVYNLACAEVRLGESDQALEHLREAIAERASFAELARKDDDFASLRGDARFEEIVGATPG
jgi:tetratricopeptide (TPR) repeat protein